MNPRQRYELLRWSVDDEGDVVWKTLGFFSSRRQARAELQKTASCSRSDCSLEIHDRQAHTVTDRWGGGPPENHGDPQC